MHYKTAEELFEAGYRFREQLTGTETVCLNGVMGAGKTHFIKGCCTALGVKEAVTSPSFALMHQYQGDYPVAHIDLYRLHSDDEFDLIGGYELLGRMICFIEWPNLIINHLTKPYFNIDISIQSDSSRAVDITKVED